MLMPFLRKSELSIILGKLVKFNGINNNERRYLSRQEFGIKNRKLKSIKPSVHIFPFFNFCG